MSILTSNAFSVTVQGSEPSWIAAAIAAGWTVGKWAKISGPSPSYGLAATNVMRDVKSVDQADSNFQKSLQNWVGGGFAPAMGDFGAYLAGFGGGHGGYNGNDLFGFDVDTRTWTELHARSSGSLDATYGTYPDGWPSQHHTYFLPVVTPAFTDYPQGAYIMPRSINDNSLQTPQAATPYPHILDLSDIAAGWTRLDEIPQSSSRGGWKNAVAALWDPSRERAVLWSLQDGSGDANHVAELNPRAAGGSQWNDPRPANTWDGHQRDQAGIEQCVYYDPNLDIVVSVAYRNGDYVHYLKCADYSEFYTNNATTWQISESGSGPPTVQGGGLDWSPALQGGVWWSGALTDGVWSFTHTSGVVGSNEDAGTLGHTWTLLTDAGNTVVPSDQVSNNNAIYNRFRIVSFDSGVEIALAVTNVDDAMFAFRIN